MTQDRLDKMVKTEISSFENKYILFLIIAES